MGARGPVPKRSAERRRRNKESKPQTRKVTGGRVRRPPASRGWHPIARSWYLALAESGQSEFYEPSDWQTAKLIAESISRDLKPQVVGVDEEMGEPIYAEIPIKGASLSAYLKAMTNLLATEGDRRRAALELERGGGEQEAPAGVVAIDDYRKRLAG